VQGGDVDMTMVSGQVVVDGGQLVHGDLHALIDDANTAVPKLFARRKAWLAAHGGPVNALVQKEA
jgi:5-methylthioadenosine/S-adenosylhomocysteine deaminase